MPSLNRVILAGNMVRDPEVRATKTGKLVCEFDIAVNERFRTSNGEYTEETLYVTVTAWESVAKTAGEYLSKGNPVLIEGRLKMDVWEAPDGKKTKLKVLCEKLVLLSPKGER